MSGEEIRDEIWNVVIRAPVRGTYLYRIPRSLGIPLSGSRVLIPFGPRRLTGYLLEPGALPENLTFTIKPVLQIIDESPVVPAELLSFLVEAASYYMHPMGDVIRTALPPGIDYTEKQGTLREPRIKARQITVVVPTLDDDKREAVLNELNRRAKAQAALLQHILLSGEISMSALRSFKKDAARLVAHLASAGLVKTELRERAPDPFAHGPVSRDEPPTLTDEQAAAVSSIVSALDRRGYQGFLLHGVTGSGKTEVYLRAIERAHQLGLGAIVLVPEIALTPQLVYRYRARFGDALAIWHSGLSEQERFDEWQSLRSGRVRVCVGVRSAVFSPVEKLGIVIVDEEHDSSFKQERGFHYHARDLALLRAARSGAVAILGSATPSLETFYNFERGKLQRISLNYRATAQPLPEVTLVDLAQHRSGPGGQQLISQPLYEAMVETLSRKEQIILFLNRRGFSPALLCTSCGQPMKCGACAVCLTYHKRPPRLECHYCGARRPVPVRCQHCEAEKLLPMGAGTQKAEDTITALFADVRVARLDRDTGAGGRAEHLLASFRRGEVDILVGTQMVTKGHDFPNVTLVGVLNADVGLQMPDFRAAERTFQLLTQVAGRAGRNERGGRAIIQTYNPGHPAIVCAGAHDWHAFSEIEMVLRQELSYPPFGRLAQLGVSSTDLGRVEAESKYLYSKLTQIAVEQRQNGVTLLGPAPAPMAQVQGRFRFRILIKAPRQDQIRRLLEPVIPRMDAPPSGVRVTLDIDPYSML